MSIREYRTATDPFILDELLNGVDEWRNVQDIIRLTFKALSDEIKAHGRSIRHLEQSLETARGQARAMPSDELFTLVNSKLSRNDLNYYMSDKVTFQDLKEALESKADLREVKLELAYFKQHLEDFQTETAKRVQGTAAFRDLQQLSELLDEKANLDEVALNLKEKANKQSVANAMNRKANKADVEAMLNHKVDTAEFQNSLDRTNAELAQLKELYSGLKAVLVEYQKPCENLDQQQIDSILATVSKNTHEFANKLEEQLQQTVKKIGEFDSKLSSSLSKKADSEVVNRLLDNLKNDVKGFIRESQAEPELARILRSCQDKVLQNEEELRTMKTYMRSAFDEVRSEAQRSHSLPDEFRQCLHKLSYIELDLDDLRAKKADRLELRREPPDPSSWKDALKIQYNELTQYIQEVHTKLQETVYQNEREILQIVERKLSSTYQGESTEYISKRLDELSRHMQGWPSDLLNDRASVEYVKELFHQVTDTIEARAVEQKTFIDDQLMINEVVCRENCVGRWIWKSGQLKKGYAVPWEVESVNTCPDNFMWEKDSTNLFVVAPGLYEIIYGVFARTKPSVQLLINGEAAIIGGCPATKTWGTHSSGNVCGLTLSDFVALPPRARICLTYNNDSTGEGFIGIKKL